MMGLRDSKHEKASAMLGVMKPAAAIHFSLEMERYSGRGF